MHRGTLGCEIGKDPIEHLNGLKLEWVSAGANSGGSPIVGISIFRLGLSSQGVSILTHLQGCVPDCKMIRDTVYTSILEAIATKLQTIVCKWKGLLTTGSSRMVNLRNEGFFVQE